MSSQSKPRASPFRSPIVKMSTYTAYIGSREFRALSRKARASSLVQELRFLFRRVGTVTDMATLRLSSSSRIAWERADRRTARIPPTLRSDRKSLQHLPAEQH